MFVEKINASPVFKCLLLTSCSLEVSLIQYPEITAFSDLPMDMDAVKEKTNKNLRTNIKIIFKICKFNEVQRK